MHPVDCFLHLFVIALAIHLDLLAQVAAADQRKNPVAFCDGQQNRIQHLVDAHNHVGIGAFELLRLATFAEQTVP